MRTTSFDIKGTDLYIKDSKVGSITPKTISVEYYSKTGTPDWPGPNNKFETEFSIDPRGRLDFRFKVTSPEGITTTKTALGLKR